MSHACTPILMGMASLVLEILLLSKMAKIFLCDHGLHVYIVHGIEMPITLHCRIAQIFFMQSN